METERDKALKRSAYLSTKHAMFAASYHAEIRSTSHVVGDEFMTSETSRGVLTSRYAHDESDVIFHTWNP